MRTKEQQEAHEKKMSDAGYYLNFEYKWVKKGHIKQSEYEKNLCNQQAESWKLKQ